MSTSRDLEDRSNPSSGEPSGPQFDFFAVLLRKKFLLLLCLGLGAAAGHWVYQQSAPSYQSSASLLVLNQRSAPLPTQTGTSSDDGRSESLLTQMILIRSPLVLKRAAENVELLKLPGYEYPGAIGRVVSSLTITQGRAGSATAPDVLDLSLKAATPEESRIVLSAIVKAYEEFLSETRRTVSDETETLITKAKDSLLVELEKKEANYRQFRERATVAFIGREVANIHADRLKDIESSRSDVGLKRAGLAAKLDAVQSTRKQAGDRGAAQFVLQELSIGDDLINPTSQARIDHAKLSTDLATLTVEADLLDDNLGPNHPKVKQLHKRIASLREILHLRSQIETPITGSPKSATDIVNAYVASLQQQLLLCDREDHEYAAMVEIEDKKNRDLSAIQSQNQDLLADIDRTQKLFEGVIKRLEEISLIKGYGGYYAQEISPPGPGVQVEPRLSRTVGSGALLGLLVGGLLAISLELSNRRFRSLDEISHELSAPILGYFPSTPPRTAARGADAVVDARLVTHHKPKSSSAEAFRGVRTALFFGAQGRGHKVIQITSPTAGDGKTTLAANLAVSIAQSGKQVVIIDADCRRPRVAKMFGIAAGDRGLISLLRGDVELEDCLEPTIIPNLTAIPVGKRPSDPAELVGSPQFAQLLQILREKFDVVIVDSPPLLPVTDPAVIATRVDGVLLVISTRKKSGRERQEAAAAVAKLTSVGANLLGLVVHGPLSRANGGDSYSYGKYNKYGYSYYDYRYQTDYSEKDELVNERPAIVQNGSLPAALPRT